MYNINQVKDLISNIYLEYSLISSVEIDRKKLDLSAYPWILEEITDNVLYLLEFIPIDEIETSWNYIIPQIDKNNLCPFIATHGDHLFCVDVSEKNYGNIFYVDWDFGVFPLKEDAKTFLSKLEDISQGNWWEDKPS